MEARPRGAGPGAGGCRRPDVERGGAAKATQAGLAFQPHGRAAEAAAPPSCGCAPGTTRCSRAAPTSCRGSSGCCCRAVHHGDHHRDGGGAGAERGTLGQLIVTPIDRTSLMLGKIVPFLLVGYVQITVILLGRLVFDVPLRGSLPLLYLMAFPFIVASLGIGLFFSTWCRPRRRRCRQGSCSSLPNILLSGFMFPRAAMPEAAQWIGLAFPLTYFLEILRGDPAPGAWGRRRSGGTRRAVHLPS
ncbi:MAG: ABC transporter permease [Gemmatimonadetes bacterium]|nr:ABC transporter permease [Gemmatimonadota bacterium]